MMSIYDMSERSESANFCDDRDAEDLIRAGITPGNSLVFKEIVGDPIESLIPGEDPKPNIIRAETTREITMVYRCSVGKYDVCLDKGNLMRTEAILKQIKQGLIEVKAD